MPGFHAEKKGSSIPSAKWVSGAKEVMEMGQDRTTCQDSQFGGCRKEGRMTVAFSQLVGGAQYWKLGSSWAGGLGWGAG